MACRIPVRVCPTSLAECAHCCESSCFLLVLFTGSASSGAAAGCVEASSLWGSLLNQDRDAQNWRTWEGKKTWMNLLKDLGFSLVTLAVWLPVALNSRSENIPEFHHSWEMLSLRCKAQSRSRPSWRQHNLSFPAVPSFSFGNVFYGLFLNELRYGGEFYEPSGFDFSSKWNKKRILILKPILEDGNHLWPGGCDSVISML